MLPSCWGQVTGAKKDGYVWAYCVAVYSVKHGKDFKWHMRKQCSCIPLTPPSLSFSSRALHPSPSIPSKCLLRVQYRLILYTSTFLFVGCLHSMQGDLFRVECELCRLSRALKRGYKRKVWNGHGHRLYTVLLCNVVVCRIDKNACLRALVWLSAGKNASTRLLVPCIAYLFCD